MTFKKLVFATNNSHKLDEARQILGSAFEVFSLDQIGCHEDIPETCITLEGNAIQKARFIKDHYLTDCFADDTGLEIEALDGQPGVISARYAGPDKDFRKNIDKVLHELVGRSNRKARFRTIIALIIGAKTYCFEGIVNGMIINSRRGSMGFGYDSIFVPDGYNITFAEMEQSEKNRISHRGEALHKLTDFLHEL